MFRHTTRAALAAATVLAATSAFGATPEMQAMVARHAQANGVPESLVHRVIQRESRYNAHASHAGNLGLMQIRHATAKGMGYHGSASGLLDAETNLTYAVKYLAGAYRVAHGSESRAMSYYRSGYYYAAKRQGAHSRMASSRGHRRPVVMEATALPTE